MEYPKAVHVVRNVERTSPLARTYLMRAIGALEEMARLLPMEEDKTTIRRIVSDLDVFRQKTDPWSDPSRQRRS